MLISVDPGLNHCGVAVWDDVGQLFKASLVTRGMYKRSENERGGKWGSMAQSVKDWVSKQSTSKVFFADPIDINQIVIEVPQVYRTGLSKGDPNDLIDVAGVVGAIIGALEAEVIWSPNPKDWKGQLPKDISVARVDSRLSSAEKTRIVPTRGTLMHNIYDALHLGLVYLEKKGLRS